MLPSKWLSLLAGCASMVLPSAGHAQQLPPSTTIPVIFTQSIKAGVAKPGDRILAKTSQVVLLPNGRHLPSGAALIGHVVASEGFALDPAAYSVPKPSVLAIHFDSIVEGESSLPIDLSARAIAGPIAAQEAETPHYRDEVDRTGTRILIGGSQFSTQDSAIVSPTGDIIGYNRKNGVFARLQAASDLKPGSSVRCPATDSEQSIGIFSADACGVYGLNSVALLENGADGKGTFVLESRQQAVTLHAGSAALLQVIAR